MNTQNTLNRALIDAGIPIPQADTETFKMVRWGRHNRYWLKKFVGGYVFGDFIDDISTYIFDENLSKKAQEKANEARTKASAKMEILSAQSQQNSAIRARRVLINADELGSMTRDIETETQLSWTNCPISGRHEYIIKKRLSMDLLQRVHIRQKDEQLIIPMYDIEGKLWSLQFINPDGSKRFFGGGKKKGCFFIFGSFEDKNRVLICEGFATGASIHEATQETVVVAFDAGNLKPVAEAIRSKYAEIELVFCADNDVYGDKNTGIDKATEAMQAVGGKIIVPVFKDTTKNPTDFNDLFVLEGKDTVKKVIYEAIASAETIHGTTIAPDFELSDKGLFSAQKKTKEPVRIGNYLKVTAFTKTAEGISRLVEFRDYNNKLQETVITSKMLTGRGDLLIVQLMNRGYIYAGTQLAKMKLLEYIASSQPKKALELVSRTGYLQGAYLRPDRLIGQTESRIMPDPVIFDTTYDINGTLDDWNRYVARYCIGNSRLILAICSAFASVLLEPCRIANFGFHFVGSSSSGKTTALKVAASVIATPKYVVTWKATDNALEAMASRHNDSLLILDELSELSPSKAGDVAYMLANGEGKKRMTKDCDLRETLTWWMIFLSSGEVDLSSHMAEHNMEAKAGQEVRLLSIPAKAGRDSHGIFEELSDFRDGAQLSDWLCKKSAQYYGTPLVRYIEQVLKNKAEVSDGFTAELQRLKAQNLSQRARGQDYRAFEKFAFVGYAGELAIKWGIVNWEPGTAESAALSCFNSWLSEKGGEGDLEEKRLIAQVRAFLEGNISSRFFDLDGFSDQKIINLAGYKRRVDNEYTYYVITSVFKNEVCKGVTRNCAVEILQKHKILQGYQQKWTPHGNKRVYVLQGKYFVDYEG